VLVTSRAPLRVAAEHVFSVPPLALPDPASLPALEALSQYESVALFIERAHAVAPAFAITDENAPAVAELCVRLDGLPLAIELAAARVKLLPPQALLARLEQRLELLRGGARDRPERQQTLRATLDWSFELLGGEEQQLFARLAVFAGGFHLEAAEVVCDASLDGVEALLEINLLRSEEQPDGEPRFFMLETIRDYASEQLETRNGSTEPRERHARWFADWLERRTLARATGDLISEWDAEDAEHENIRAALAWARQSGDVDVELRLAGSAGRFYWPNRGLLTEGRRWLEEALARADEADEGRRALAMSATAHLAWRQGDPERCEELAAEAQTIFERTGDRLSLGYTLMARGIAAESRGDVSAEATHYDRAELIFRELGQTDSLNAILNNRAYTEIVVGNFEQAERHLREIADSARGEPRLYALVNHGLALACLSRIDEAAIAFTMVLRDSTGEIRSAEIEFYSLEGLATLSGRQDDDLRAARLWGASAAIREEAGFVLAMAEQRLHDEVAAEVRGRLGEDLFKRAWNEGRQLPREQAVELALREP
jgi:predicted ATPase